VKPAALGFCFVSELSAPSRKPAAVSVLEAVIEK
jgi:hypothetical protein